MSSPCNLLLQEMIEINACTRSDHLKNSFVFLYIKWYKTLSFHTGVPKFGLILPTLPHYIFMLKQHTQLTQVKASFPGFFNRSKIEIVTEARVLSNMACLEYVYISHGDPSYKRKYRIKLFTRKCGGIEKDQERRQYLEERERGRFCTDKTTNISPRPQDRKCPPKFA